MYQRGNDQLSKSMQEQMSHRRAGLSITATHLKTCKLSLFVIQSRKGRIKASLVSYGVDYHTATNRLRISTQDSKFLHCPIFV